MIHGIFRPLVSGVGSERLLQIFCKYNHNPPNLQLTLFEGFFKKLKKKFENYLENRQKLPTFASL